MKSAPTLRQEQTADRIARQITARLSEGEALLPYEITERLRASASKPCLYVAAKRLCCAFRPVLQHPPRAAP